MPPTAISNGARSRRPAGARKAATPAVIRQRWEDLLFLHWRPKPAAVARLLPPGLELDTYDGQAYVGLVPFTVPLNRVLGVPAPLTPPFHEVNLRTYVKGPAGDPAVWFFSLDASSRIASVGGSAFFSLPYHHAEIQFSREERGQPGNREWIRFDSRRVKGDPPDCAARYSPAGLPRTAVLGTLEHFLIERYVLYAWTGTRLLRGRVRHEPYAVQDAVIDSLEERLFASARLSRPKADPLAHYARGVTVDISWPKTEEP